MHSITCSFTGAVDGRLLEHIAHEIGEDWKRLAQCLNVRRVRIQAILRNNVNSDTHMAINEMLLSWVKRMPRSVNKV